MPAADKPNAVAALIQDAVAITGATPVTDLGTIGFVLWQIPGEPGTWQTATLVDHAINRVGLDIHAAAVAEANKVVPADDAA